MEPEQEQEQEQTVVAFTVVEESTGRILYSGTCPVDMLHLQSGGGGLVVPGTYLGAQFWFDGADVISRPEIDVPEAVALAVGEDWTLFGIPQGTQLRVDGEPLPANAVSPEGEVTFEFEMAATYLLEFIPPHPWVRAACQVVVS